MHPFIIFDSEFTAWPGSWENNWSRPGEYREIIQIAAALIDPFDHYKIKSEFDILVKPSVNPYLSSYIQNLTGISQKDIDKHGVNFSQALREFYMFCKKGSLKAYCYGADQNAFIETCKLNKLNFTDYFENFYDIRDVFKKAGIDTSKYESGTLYKSVGLSFNKKQHYALNDVKSIVVTLQYLHKKGDVTDASFLNCPISGTV